MKGFRAFEGKRFFKFLDFQRSKFSIYKPNYCCDKKKKKSHVATLSKR